MPRNYQYSINIFLLMSLFLFPLRYLDRWILNYQTSVLPRATCRDGESRLAGQCACVVAGIRGYATKGAYT